MSAPWITYRPELKVLDCTIRDGGQSFLLAGRESQNVLREFNIPTR